MASRYEHLYQIGKAPRQHEKTGADSEAAVFPGWLERMGTWASFAADSPMAFTRPDLSRVRRLVFVCSANLVRSAYAQALCVKAGIAADSFGLHTRTGMRTFTTPARVAAAMGADIGQHRACHWRDFESEDGDLYLVMDPSQARQLVRRGFPTQQIALLGHWSCPRRLHIRDAFGKSEADLRRCFALIRSAVDGLVREIQAAAPGARHPAGQKGQLPLPGHAAPKERRAPLAWALAGAATASLIDF